MANAEAHNLDPIAVALDEIRAHAMAATTLFSATPAILAVSANDVPRLMTVVDAVLALHGKQERPVRSYDVSDRCAEHQMTASGRMNFAAMRDCPDCRYTEYHVCAHCQCPDDEWPCPTVRVVARVLTGDTDG